MHVRLHFLLSGRFTSRYPFERRLYVVYSGGLDHVIGKVKLSCHCRHCRESNYDSTIVNPPNLVIIGPRQITTRLTWGNIGYHSHENPFFPTSLSESIMVIVHRGKVFVVSWHETWSTCSKKEYWGRCQGPPRKQRYLFGENSVMGSVVIFTGPYCGL